MKLLAALTFATVLISGANSGVHADVIHTFSATGTFADGTIMSGTISLDVTTGGITDNLQFSQGVWPVGPLTATGGMSSFALSAGSPILLLGGTDSPAASDPAGLYPQRTFVLQLPVTTLVGYGGGPITPGANLATTGPFSLIQQFPTDLPLDNTLFTHGIALVSGQLTLVPEPATIGMLATAIVGLGLFVRRRKAIA